MIAVPHLRPIPPIFWIDSVILSMVTFFSNNTLKSRFLAVLQSRTQSTYLRKLYRVTLRIITISLYIRMNHTPHILIVLAASPLLRRLVR